MFWLLKRSRILTLVHRFIIEMSYFTITINKCIIIFNVENLIAQFNKESPTTRKEEAHRREMARKKAMNHGTRALRFHLDTPKFTRGRQNVDIQTDTHLEEVRSSKIFIKHK